MLERFTLHHVEEKLWVVTAPTGLAAYDFEFAPRFAVRHPAYLEGEVTALARMGAAEDYDARYAALLELGIRLVHSPEQYRLSSWLPRWLERLEGLTPRSRCFEAVPTVEEVGDALGWPLFLKGARQTSRHRKSLCVARDAEDLARILALWSQDSILRWQPVVCREWAPLRRVAEGAEDQLQRSFELRSFWYRGRLAGMGPYWTTARYEPTARERSEALALGEEAARRLALPFVVIDLALREDGRWTVIECNDGQDSGYAGVDRVALWSAMLRIEGEARWRPG